MFTRVLLLTFAGTRRIHWHFVKSTRPNGERDTFSNNRRQKAGRGDTRTEYKFFEISLQTIFHYLYSVDHLRLKLSFFGSLANFCPIPFP